MPWAATDDCESYSTGANLDTLNGGSGWSGGWTKVTGDTGESTIQTPPAGGQGTKAIRLLNTSVVNAEVYSRSFTAISAGAVSWKMLTNTAAPGDDQDFRLGDDGAGGSNMYIKFQAGQIKIYNNTGATYENLAAYSANTWYDIDLEFDDTAQPDSYRARVNGGTWSGWKTVNGGTYSTIGKITIANAANSGTDELWIDDIKPSGAVTVTPGFKVILTQP